MTAEWRLINSGCLTGAENMALDEALLHSVAAGDSGPVLRLYRWAPATVTLGYGQRGAEVVNLTACRHSGIDVVRRCTGGRAVLHDQEMTYAVISPVVSSVFPGGILNNYQVIARALQQTLMEFGPQVTLATDRSRGVEGQGAERSACFTAPGQFELLYDGKKLAGCAQKRLGDFFLQHGSVPLNMDLEKLFLALNTNPEADQKRGIEQLSRYIGWLNRWLDEPVSIGSVEEKFIEQFGCLTLGRLVQSEPTSAEMRATELLLRQRYAQAEWTQRGLGVKS